MRPAEISIKILCSGVKNITSVQFINTHSITLRPMEALRAPPQKSIFVQESPNELKFIGYVGGIM